MDIFESIDHRVRVNISLGNMTFMLSKEFLCFRQEDITDLHVFLRFSDKVRLENHSTMSKQEVFMSEIFGRHPSDQCRALNYFISHI